MASWGDPVASNFSSPATKWRRARDAGFASFDCGDGFVIYHRLSGKTHLLNDSSYYLLTDLLNEPMGLEEIAETFDPGHDDVSASEYTNQMASMLLRLEQFGLIERS